jgi:hypothetical protein
MKLTGKENSIIAHYLTLHHLELPNSFNWDYPLSVNVQEALTNLQCLYLITLNIWIIWSFQLLDQVQEKYGH